MTSEFLHFRLIKRLSAFPAFLIALMLLLFVAFVDYLVTYEIALSVFYLIPISVAVAFSGFRYGIIISLLSAAAWYYNDLHPNHQYSHPLMPVWNALMRLTYFILHSYFLARYRSLLSKSQKEAITDSLTGLRNARFFLDEFRREYARAVTHNYPLTLVYIDLDHFKTVNDTLGHSEGDRVLRTLAEAGLAHLSRHHIFARFGGDEFVILLPREDYAKAAKIIQDIFSDAMARFERADWPVTLSIGAVTYYRLTGDVDALMREADALLYQVKASGRKNIRHLSVD
jgi:diguanylate cyclase (GGDEF)-like protein